MNLSKYIVTVLSFFIGMCGCVAVRAADVYFNVLDQWDCGQQLKCAIAIDPQERVVLITTRGDTLVTVVHRGKVIYQEPKPKDKKL